MYSRMVRFCFTAPDPVDRFYGRIWFVVLHSGVLIAVAALCGVFA